jgi:DNA-binding response OmpR family regulator
MPALGLVSASPDIRRVCLVAEDQALIGMLIQDELEEAGFAVAGPFRSCAEALAALRHETPAFALIDYMLSDGPCRDLARELRRRAIPFAVLSGYDHRAPDGDAEWQGVPWLVKPVSSDLLRRVMLDFASNSRLP